MRQAVFRWVIPVAIVSTGLTAYAADPHVRVLSRTNATTRPLTAAPPATSPPPTPPAPEAIKRMLASVKPFDLSAAGPASVASFSTVPPSVSGAAVDLTAMGPDTVDTSQLAHGLAYTMWFRPDAQTSARSLPLARGSFAGVDVRIVNLQPSSLYTMICATDVQSAGEASTFFFGVSGQPTEATPVPGGPTSIAFYSTPSGEVEITLRMAGDPATQHWAVSGCQLYPN